MSAKLTNRSLEILRENVRASVCPRCPQRPARSEKLAADQPRSCEAECLVFRALPTLAELARRLDPMLVSRECVMRDSIRDVTEKSCRSWTRSARTALTSSPAGIARSGGRALAC